MLGDLTIAKLEWKKKNLNVKFNTIKQSTKTSDNNMGYDASIQELCFTSYLKWLQSLQNVLNYATENARKLLQNFIMHHKSISRTGCYFHYTYYIVSYPIYTYMSKI